MGQCDRGVCLSFRLRAFLPCSEDRTEHLLCAGNRACHCEETQTKHYLCSRNMATGDHACVLNGGCFHDLYSPEGWLRESGAGPASLRGPGGSSKGPDAPAGRVHAQCEGPCARRLSEGHWLRHHGPVQPQPAGLPHRGRLLPSRQGNGFQREVNCWLSFLVGEITLCRLLLHVSNPDSKPGNLLLFRIFQRRNRFREGIALAYAFTTLKRTFEPGRWLVWLSG